jgi:uncharacterized membrane protein YwzB
MERERGHMKYWGISTINLEKHVKYNKTVKLEHGVVIYISIVQSSFSKKENGGTRM